MEFGPLFWMYSEKKVSQAQAKYFNQVLRTLLNNLKVKAAYGGSGLKFANGTTRNSPKIYALVQCTPDLSKKQCTECLTNATALLPQCCDGKAGGRVVAPAVILGTRLQVVSMHDLPCPVLSLQLMCV